VIKLRHALPGFLCACLVVGCVSAASPTASIGPSEVPTVSASPPISPSISASPAPVSPSTALPAEVDIESAGALTIEATPSIDWLVLVDGQAWIAGLGDGVGVLGKSGKLERSVAVAGWCEAMDTGFGAVWSASCEPAGIIRIDQATAAVSRAAFDLPIEDSEASVGVGEGAVWVVAGHRSDALFGIDPTTLKVAHRYPIPAGGAGVRAGLGGVWVTRPEADELLHVDPATGNIVATIAVGPAPRFLAVGEDAVWVMNQGDGSVSRIDPTTDKVTATIDAGEAIHGGDIAVGGGSVWVRGGPELLARIDPDTNRVIERFSPHPGSGSVAADDDAVWVTAHDVSTIWRLPLR
jgi:virginiamycin B lyase